MRNVQHFQVSFLVMAFALLTPGALWANADALLYPGVTVEQDRLVKSVLEHFYALDWEMTDKSILQLQQLEHRRGLLPFSSLMLVAVRVWRIQNNEYADPKKKAKILNEIDKFARRGILALHATKYADSTRSTRLFLEGGINGFKATLLIKSNPFLALGDGLRAVQLLDTAIHLDPFFFDAYLGLGIFNCALAKSSRLVQDAVDLLQGRKADFDTGLCLLRICAANAVYTNYAAQIYLTQFLSPYLGDQAQEKRGLFRSLQRAFPTDPLFVFLELDERLCFFPDSFFQPSTPIWIERRIIKFDCPSYSTIRYRDLVQQQYCLSAGLPDRPDSVNKIFDFSFYPVFLDAVALRQHEKTAAGQFGEEHNWADSMQKLESTAIRRLSSSEMNPIRKEYYLWHIRDALGPR
jgi:hypothetical protein